MSNHLTETSWNQILRRVAVALLLGLLALSVATAQSTDDEASPDLEELLQRVEQLEAEIGALKESGEGEPGASPEVIAELERRIDLLAEELERLDLGRAAARADAAEKGFGPAASKIYRTEEGLSIGGYGEVLYQDPESRRDDGSPSGATAELDALRAILYVGYKFSDRWLFNSEIEFEHGGAHGGEGEAVLEFAYLDYLWRPELGVRAGLLLLPMGLVNELHEPTVFLSAQRPEVERRILPTTWRENGFGLFGDVGSVSYRTYVVNGFDASGFDASGLRGGRQSGAEAKAEDFAWVGRLDWQPTLGLLVGGSLYVGDAGQDLTDPAGTAVGVSTRIFEAHAEWRRGGLLLRGLVAVAELDDVPRLDAALGLTGMDTVGERLEGYYLEAGYDLFAAWPRGEQSLTPFVRFETLDTQAEVPTGFTADPAMDRDFLTFGLNWKPIDRVVVKADWRNGDNAAGTGLDQFNLALGYVF